MRIMKLLVFISVLLLGVSASGCLYAQAAKEMPDSSAQKIMAQFGGRFGFVPDPLVLLSERSGAVPDFMAYGNRLMAGGPLTVREINLVTLSAAVALKSPGCVRNQIRKLKKLNVSDAEIVQTVMISAVIGNTSALQEAFAVLSEESVMDHKR